jgi:hypothetical protein
VAILAECPIYHRKQKTKNKKCACGQDLDKAKGSKKVRYWISYYLPDGKQRREAVGSFEGLNPCSIEDAKTALQKRHIQKKEKRLLDIKADSTMTFKELTSWYLNLEKMKAKKSYWRMEIALNNFNAEFGHVIVSDIKPVDLENYQVKRAKKASDGTVDKEISIVHTMISKAFDNDLITGDTLKTFKRIQRLLKGNTNARDRVLSLDEYHRLMDHLSAHLKPIIATAFFTGMRRGGDFELGLG